MKNYSYKTLDITELYVNPDNSTLLNIIADKLKIKGQEHATSNSFGIVNYCERFTEIS